MRAYKDMDAGAGIFILQMQTLAQGTYMQVHVQGHMQQGQICATLFWQKRLSRLADLGEQCIEHVGSLGGSPTTWVSCCDIDTC